MDLPFRSKLGGTATSDLDSLRPPRKTVTTGCDSVGDHEVAAPNERS